MLRYMPDGFGLVAVTLGGLGLVFALLGLWLHKRETR